MDSLKVTDDASAAVAVAPRVALVDIEGSLIWTTYIQGECLFQVMGHASMDWNGGTPPPMEAVKTLKVFTICIAIHRNGFSIVGKSAPASPDNYNPELGRRLAYEDCIRQLWPLMGFALREKLSHG